MLARFGKAFGGHTRDMNVHYYTNKLVYSIPLYGERRELGKLVGVKVDSNYILLEFDVCRTELKKDQLYQTTKVDELVEGLLA
jgi:hypothetical protein